MICSLPVSIGCAPDVVVVVPTRNSARTIESCLRSLRDQTYPCRVVVVDNASSDGTPRLAGRLADVVINAGPERSAQRNLGAEVKPLGLHVGFVDSDMLLGSTVVAEAVAALRAGAVAVVVPEVTIGDGYWARVRAFERSFYGGHVTVEAARFFRREAFAAVGGFDEMLTGAEDWDLTIRVRGLGKVERTQAPIQHDEGRVRYLDACRKKGYYAEGLRRFVRKHGRSSLTVVDRPYIRRPQVFASPLGAGLIALKLGEAAAIAAALARSWRSPVQ